MGAETAKLAFIALKEETQQLYERLDKLVGERKNIEKFEFLTAKITSLLALDVKLLTYPPTTSFHASI